jgi:LacI family transcriptional regulator
MDEKLSRRRATVHDVARHAGVSLATVDRVLNARPGVRAETAERVANAIRDLDFRRDVSASMLARSRDLSIVFLIPDGGNAFMLSLLAAIARRGRAARAERLMLETRKMRAFDATALAAAITSLTPRNCDCAVVVATEHTVVRRAIDAAVRRGVPVITLVSDLPGSARRHFVGIDNVAAGRTAASLLGRFCPTGRIGLIAGSLDLRDHRERREGFEAVLRTEFPALEIVGTIEGLDDDRRTRLAAAELLRLEPELAGIYNLGAGNAGLLAALGESGRAGEISVIAHELSEVTRHGLATGAIDVVLDQNPDREIGAAIAAARAVLLRHESDRLSEPIEIGIFVRDNLR